MCIERARAVATIQLFLERWSVIQHIIKDVGQHLERDNRSLGARCRGARIKLWPLEPFLFESREGGQFSDDIAGADLGDGIFHGQVHRAVDGDMRADRLVGRAGRRNAFDVIGDLGEATEETYAPSAMAFDPGDRVVNVDLDRAREDVKRSGAVLTLAHDELARRVILAHDRAGKLLPNFFAYRGKIGYCGQLAGGEDLAP